MQRLCLHYLHLLSDFTCNNNEPSSVGRIITWKWSPKTQGGRRPRSGPNRNKSKVTGRLCQDSPVLTDLMWALPLMQIGGTIEALGFCRMSRGIGRDPISFRDRRRNILKEYGWPRRRPHHCIRLESGKTQEGTRGEGRENWRHGVAKWCTRAL